MNTWELYTDVFIILYYERGDSRWLDDRPVIRRSVALHNGAVSYRQQCPTLTPNVHIHDMQWNLVSLTV
jgi:hypothetical protein